MSYNWEVKLQDKKTQITRIAAILKNKNADKVHSTFLVNRIASDYDQVAGCFNKIAIRSDKQAYMNKHRSPVHCLKGKYTATALALLDYVKANNIPLDRWILAQFEIIKLPILNLFHCYGEPALERYVDWEQKQLKKYIKAPEREKQTDSNLAVIHDSIVRGHVAALSWIPQLTKIEPPDCATALYFLLPNITGWYCLCYAEFREQVMDIGLCDHKHMVAWYNKFKRSKNIRNTCEKALVEAQNLFGKLEW